MFNLRILDTCNQVKPCKNVERVFLTLLIGLYKKCYIFSVKSVPKAPSLKVNRNLVQGSFPSQRKEHKTPGFYET